MTATHAPMPPVDPAALHCAPVDHATILSTLAWQIAVDLWPEVGAVEVTKADDRASVTASIVSRQIDGARSVCVELYFAHGACLTATMSDDVTCEFINAPDRGLARDMLACLRGDR